MARRFSGILSPVLTPFDADLRPNSQKFIEHCRWLIANEVGLAIFGTNSEANSLSISERLSLLDELLAAGVDPVRMMPGTGCCALPDTVLLTRHAVAAGCGGVLMLPPFFYKGISDDGLFRSYAEVIERVGDRDLRIYLYHIPPVAQVPISAGLIERLLKAYPGTVAGIKDSSGDWQHTAMLLKNFQSDAFDVFCGSEVFLLQTLRGGGAGSITATANVNPAMIHDLFVGWQNADADDKQARITAIRHAFELAPLIASMKAVVAWKRGDAQWAEPRPPLMPAAREKVAELRQALTALSFEMKFA